MVTETERASRHKRKWHTPLAHLRSSPFIRTLVWQQYGVPNTFALPRRQWPQQTRATRKGTGRRKGVQVAEYRVPRQFSCPSQALEHHPSTDLPQTKVLEHLPYTRNTTDEYAGGTQGCCFLPLTPDMNEHGWGLSRQNGTPVNAWIVAPTPSCLVGRDGRPVRQPLATVAALLPSCPLLPLASVATTRWMGRA